MFPLLTQGFPTTRSKPSCTHSVKLLIPSMTLLDLPFNSRIHDFSATFLTTVHSQMPFLSTRGSLCPSLRATGSCRGKISYFPVMACCQHPLPNPRRAFFQSLESFQSPLVNSFSTSHCRFLISTVFPHTSADGPHSAFY